MQDAPPDPNCAGCQTLLRRVAQLEQANAHLKQMCSRLEQTVERLQRRIAQLEARLGMNSSNSDRPPSSDHGSSRPERRKRAQSGRKPGGQPGHERHTRAAFPPEQVTRRVHREPRRCHACQATLTRAERLEPQRHQVVELPQIQLDVTEYVLERRRCAHCGTITRAALQADVPTGLCGPRLSALIALLDGVHHLSRRNTQSLLADIFGLKLSLGAMIKVEHKIADALVPAYDEALGAVRRSRVKHLDATSWFQNGVPRWVWTYSSRAASAFQITVSAATQAVRELVGTCSGTLVTDRGSQFRFWALEKRQICWAHLLRKFVFFAEHRDARVKRLGEALLFWSEALLLTWHRVQDGRERRRTLRRVAEGIEPYVLAQLKRAVTEDLPDAAGVCANILAHREALFTFTRVADVPATNNAAERDLRSIVQWRKQTAGTRSETGSRFAERITTVAATLRKHGRHVLSFLEGSYSAMLRHERGPPLLPCRP